MPEISMPRLSDTMEEGTITRWLKKPGDAVKKGDIVAEVETDKASMEIESYSTGILEQILVQEGEVAPIGQAIATVGSGAAVQSQGQAAASATSTQPTAATQSAPTPVAAGVSARTEQVSAPERSNGNGNGTLKSSPLARRMAEEHGIDLAQIRGTGPGGRIVRDDIEDVLEQRSTTVSTVTAPAEVTPPAPAAVTPAAATVVVESDDEIVKLSTMQKTVARRLTESKKVCHIFMSVMRSI